MTALVRVLRMKIIFIVDRHLRVIHIVCMIDDQGITQSVQKIVIAHLFFIFVIPPPYSVTGTGPTNGRHEAVVPRNYSCTCTHVIKTVTCTGTSRIMPRGEGQRSLHCVDDEVP